MLGLHSKILKPKINTDIWSRITGVVVSEEESSSLQPYLREVPVLLKDPAALLLQILLNLPSMIDRGKSAKTSTVFRVLPVLDGNGWVRPLFCKKSHHSAISTLRRVCGYGFLLFSAHRRWLGGQWFCSCFS
jgi:hypothetical protein